MTQDELIASMTVLNVEDWLEALNVKESPYEVEALVNFYQARTTKALAALETGF